MLAYGVELAVEFDESLTRQRFLAEMGQDVMLLQTLDDARRLLEAGDTDPALLDGLEAAQAELTTLSKSRLHQYAAAGAGGLHAIAADLRAGHRHLYGHGRGGLSRPRNHRVSRRA